MSARVLAVRVVLHDPRVNPFVKVALWWAVTNVGIQPASCEAGHEHVRVVLITPLGISATEWLGP